MAPVILYYFVDYGDAFILRTYPLAKCNGLIQAPLDA
jgi:hypothetical protein